MDELGELLEPGDIVVDGGNSRWTDDEKHGAELPACSPASPRARTTPRR
ncbi:hypothetical protein [Streptacidiphilus jeojiense]